MKDGGWIILFAEKRVPNPHNLSRIYLTASSTPARRPKGLVEGALEGWRTEIQGVLWNQRVVLLGTYPGTVGIGATVSVALR